MDIKIKNQTIFHTEIVLNWVMDIVKLGKISQNETCYCYLTTMKISRTEILQISCRKTKKSYIFNIQINEDNAKM
jgi:D-mannonate dehydratase